MDAMVMVSTDSDLCAIGPDSKHCDLVLSGFQTLLEFRLVAQVGVAHRVLSCFPNNSVSYPNGRGISCIPYDERVGDYVEARSALCALSPDANAVARII